MSRGGEWSWDRCEATTQKLFEALDWRALGAIYFHDDGEARWQELLPRVLTLGNDWARALLKRVPPTGRSLYVGAGIAELPVLLAERFVRSRDVVALNLRQRECELIQAGLARCGLMPRDLAIVPGDAATAARPGAFDHLGCVSVLTDPKTWPLVSGVAYGRIPPVQLDVEAFVAERERARGFAATLFAALQRPAWITTSVEEAPWFLEQATRHGAALAVDGASIATAVVGDAVGFLRVQ